MLHHLLLVLFLIGLSLPAMAVPAHAGDAAVDCHGAQPENAPHKKADDSGGKIGHVCIGCVANPALPAVEMPLTLCAALPVARPMATLAGADIPPSIPPPRS